jgi:hypothetical protein
MSEKPDHKMTAAELAVERRRAREAMKQDHEMTAAELAKLTWPKTRDMTLWAWETLVERILAAGRKQLSEQIERLAQVIIHEIPGEPSQSQGAIDTAIRIMREQGALDAADVLSKFADEIEKRGKP